MRGKTLIDYLENSTKDTLINKMRIAGLKYTGLAKVVIVAKLEEFLRDEQNLGKIWNSLSPFEKEYLDEFLKYEEMLDYIKIKYLYQKHGVQESPYRDPWDERSRISFFFIGRSVPPQIKKLLAKYLTPIVIKYNTLEEPPEDKSFLINQVEYISCFSEKYREYHAPWVEWEQVEGRFIEVVLQEYLSVLGIVDTVIHESEGGSSDYEQHPFFKVDYFRITPLGAFVLGMSNDYSYEEPVTEKSRAKLTHANEDKVEVM